MTQHYDAVIVGSGASGGAVAYTLAHAGFKVALLEKGRLIKRDEFSKDELAYCRRNIVTPNLFDEYHMIEEMIDRDWTETPTYQSGWSFWNGNIVGGSSNFMSGMVHRMHPDDFRLLSAYGEIENANIVDWPISYEEMEPYYTLVETLVGISGAVKPHLFASPRSTPDFPQPPTLENRVVELFDKHCQVLGFTPLITPRAILSQDRGDRNGCYYSNFCGSYGCSSGAKGSSMEALIKPALATGNLTLMSNSHVTKLTGGKERVTSVEIVDTITGKTKKLSAKIFVVAAQAHESVRLLFNSANIFYPNGLGNSSGELGKNLIFSAGGSGEGVLHKQNLEGITFDALMEHGLFMNRSLLDWYIIDRGQRKEKGGLAEFMLEHQNIILRSLKLRNSDKKLRWGKDLGDTLSEQFTKTRTIHFEVFNDWLPTDNCYVTIDPDRKDKFGMPVGKLRIYSHPHDLEIASRIAKNCEMLLGQMGAREIKSNISTTPPQNLIAGGCRFGNNPKNSVLNKYCQSHDLPNLFVADASFMPTGGSTPYTWTIFANAFRIAEYMTDQLKKGVF